MFYGEDSIAPLAKPTAFQAERTWIATGTALTGNGTITNYNTIRLDTHSAFSGGFYTIPVSGLWYIEFFMREDATSIGDIFLNVGGSGGAPQCVSRHYGRWSSTRVVMNRTQTAGAQISASLLYTTTRNSYCSYQLWGYLKRGMV